ncbi:heavy metal translocating P-type ATPase [Rhodobacter capsulatus]|uniref:P-type Zn(2+) transporter n=1 Tax=Rhodobacter capsulatus TaxID=1061 RepID=A0A1G7D654_RHOCA|nr:heavy metal translocating P-type ATPase [Rhodobacter capsulatus]WER10906.1 heavy metal translocating P-type ATPase [Rhodobacter capsulatus]SDE47011.1 Cd2+/Zn2+-exporting ATPase [Rhodobacter capsulatus]
MTNISQLESCEWQVGGMDCAACAGKVRTAVERLPGVEAVEIALMSERLRARLTPGATSPAELERTVTRLGYTITRIGAAPPVPVLRRPESGHDHGHGHDHDHGGAPECGCGGCGCGAASPAPEAAPEATPEATGAQPVPPAALWMRGPKAARLFWSAGGLAFAWGVALALPALAAPAFALACLGALFPVARQALALARTGQPFTIEMLMTVAAIGALMIGAAAEAAMVVVLFALGELLESIAAARARDGLRALARQMPETALLELDGQLQEVAAAALLPGQILRLRPGDRAPVDAEIVEGVSGLDESAVTGESVPVTRGPGERVLAGSINTEALLRLRVTRAAEDSTLARIARMVAEAEAAKAPVERFIDRFSRWYMPLIVGLAALVAVLPPLLTGADWGVWIYRALALLLIGCPCALVISVPAAMAAALSTGARRGLLVKGGAVIEALARLRVVALDKTGTLTPGRPLVTDLLPAAGVPVADLLAHAAAVEAGSSHPLARAILARAAAEGVTAPAASAARVIPGVGAEARIAGALWRIAAPAAGNPQAAALQAEAKTVVELCRDGVPQGLIALRDEPRPEAGAALAALRGLGLESVMLTGDAEAPARALAAPFGLAVKAGLLPEDKCAEVTRLSGQGGVLMLGDGINDAPALRAADVGVAIGAGTDVAIETADAVLMRNDLTDLPALIRLSRQTLRNIRQNVAIALGLKAVFLVTSVFGITGLWIAVLADTGATVLVTANALRLLRYDPRRAA